MKPIYEMHEFPEHLAMKGHEVGFWHFPEGYGPSMVKSLGWKRQIAGRVVSGSKLTLFTPPIVGSPFGRLLTSLAAHHYAKRVIRDFEPQLVVSFSVPTQGWQVIRVARRLGLPVLFRALDVSHKIRPGIFRRLIRLSEFFVYRTANWVSANNPAMLEYCRSMGAHPGTSSVEWPLIDLSRFGEAEVIPGIKGRLGIPKDRKVVLYMGSFFYFSGLPEVIREFSKSSSLEHLVLIGSGDQDLELRELVRKLGVEDKVTFTGLINFVDLPKYLKLADVAINPMHPSLVSNAAIPNKILQYLASGLKVVSTRLTGLELSFGHSNSLHLVNTPEDVVSEALKLCREGSEESDGRNEAIDLRRFSLESALAAFDKRCCEVASHV